MLQFFFRGLGLIITIVFISVGFSNQSYAQLAPTKGSGAAPAAGSTNTTPPPDRKPAAEESKPLSPEAGSEDFRKKACLNNYVPPVMSTCNGINTYVKVPEAPASGGTRENLHTCADTSNKLARRLEKQIAACERAMIRCQRYCSGLDGGRCRPKAAIVKVNTGKVVRNKAADNQRTCRSAATALCTHKLSEDCYSREQQKADAQTSDFTGDHNGLQANLGNTDAKTGSNVYVSGSCADGKCAGIDHNAPQPSITNTSSAKMGEDGLLYSSDNNSQLTSAGAEKAAEFDNSWHSTDLSAKSFAASLESSGIDPGPGLRQAIADENAADYRTSVQEKYAIHDFHLGDKGLGEDPSTQRLDNHEYNDKRKDLEFLEPPSEEPSAPPPEQDPDRTQKDKIVKDKDPIVKEKVQPKQEPKPAPVQKAQNPSEKGGGPQGQQPQQQQQQAKNDKKDQGGSGGGAGGGMGGGGAAGGAASGTGAGANLAANSQAPDNPSLGNYELKETKLALKKNEDIENIAEGAQQRPDIRLAEGEPAKNNKNVRKGQRRRDQARRAGLGGNSGGSVRGSAGGGAPGVSKASGGGTEPDYYKYTKSQGFFGAVASAFGFGGDKGDEDEQGVDYGDQGKDKQQQVQVAKAEDGGKAKSMLQRTWDKIMGKSDNTQRGLASAGGYTPRNVFIFKSVCGTYSDFLQDNHLVKDSYIACPER